MEVEKFHPAGLRNHVRRICLNLLQRSRRRNEQRTLKRRTALNQNIQRRTVIIGAGFAERPVRMTCRIRVVPDSERRVAPGDEITVCENGLLLAPVVHLHGAVIPDLIVHIPEIKLLIRCSRNLFRILAAVIRGPEFDISEFK